MNCQCAGNVFFAELLTMCASNTHTQGLLAVAICQVWRLDFNMLVPGRTHILSCLLQVLPQQRIFLSEFRKKSKSLVLLLHLLLSPGLGSGGHGSFREYLLSHPVLGGLFREWTGWVHDIWLEEELDLSKCPRWTTLSFKVPERTIWRESCQDNRHVFYSETEPWIPTCEPLRVAWRRCQSFLFGIVVKAEVLVAQSCPALCSPPGFSVCGILQATILEWLLSPSSHPLLPSPRVHKSVLYICFSIAALQINFIVPSF